MHVGHANLAPLQAMKIAEVSQSSITPVDGEIADQLFDRSVTVLKSGVIVCRAWAIEMPPKPSILLVMRPAACAMRHWP
jgi:hypothetical protein